MIEKILQIAILPAYMKNKSLGRRRRRRHLERCELRIFENNVSVGLIHCLSPASSDDLASYPLHTQIVCLPTSPIR